MVACKVCVMFLIISCINAESKGPRKLPDDLQIGAAVSSYQIEGAWNKDGKGESIWDHLVHNNPTHIADNSTGDIACDSYHKIKEDVALLKQIGMQHYRFSISWVRILPNGFANRINQSGVKYYNELIDALIAAGITPMVTIYHWELPQSLQDLGGWVNPDITLWFKNFAKVVFQQFGDRVKTWITINEPKQICELGYGNGYFAPALSYSGTADYLCTRNVLLAHAQVYHMYDKVFRKLQKGRIGITVECSWSEAATNTDQDEKAAHRMRQFDFGIYTNPIFHKNGDFPSIVKERVHNRSLAEGFPVSRLPKLTETEIDFIKGTYDFFGLNHYTTSLVRNKVADPIGDHPARDKDLQVEVSSDPNWLTGSFPYFKLVPWGFRKALSYIKTNYGNPEIIITENGFPDFGELDDKNRIKYHTENLGAVLDAIFDDGVKVKAYTVWSLMDNFEWSSGYTIRFGLYHVNFSDPSRPRTPKSSCDFFKTLLQTRTL